MSTSFRSSKYKNDVKEMSGYQFAIDTQQKSSPTQTRTQFSDVRSFQIGIDTVAPLLAQLNEQNIQLKYQKQFITEELFNIKEISKSLLQQNQQLMKHYQNRTNDLSRVVKTILINTNEDHNDLSQSISYYQTSNTRIVRDLNFIIKQNKGIQDENINLNKLLKEVGLKKYQLEDRYMKISVKNQKNTQIIPQLQINLVKSNTNYLQSTINQLLYEVSKIKKNNRVIAYKLKNKKQKVDQNNPQVIYQRLKSPRQKNQRLKQQLQQLQQNLQSRFIPKKQKLQKQYRKNKSKTDQLQLQWNNKIIELDKLNFKCSKINKKILSERLYKLKQNARIQQAKQYQLNKLRTKVGNLKLQRESRIQRKRAKISGIVSEYDQKINKIRNNIGIEMKRQFQVAAQDMAHIDTILNQLKIEDSLLQEQLQEYERVIQGEHDPFGEILAIEHTLQNNKINRY